MVESTSRNWPVEFDPTVPPPGSVRALTELELAAIWIYLEKTHELSKSQRNAQEHAPNYPRPHLFDGMFRRKIYQTLKESGAFEGIESFDDRKNLIRQETKLFRGLFFDSEGNDLRDTLTSSDIIRRIGGLGNIFYTDDDLRQSLRAMDRELIMSTPGYAAGSITYRQASRFAEELWIVPEINVVCPHPSTILDRLSPQSRTDRSWINVLESVFNTNVERERQRKSGFSLDDLRSDYEALTRVLREEKPDSQYLPQTADFIDRSRTDTYAIRADEYMKVLNKYNMTLDDLRESLGYERLKPTKGPPRKEKISWSDSGKKSREEVQDAIMDGYIKAWAKAHGRSVETDDDIRELVSNFSPPRKKDLDEFCKSITKKSQTTKLGDEDVLPSQTMVHEYFGGFNPLLARIEGHYGVDVCLDNPYQLTSLAAVAKPKDPNKPALRAEQVPLRVRERIFEI